MKLSFATALLAFAMGTKAQVEELPYTTTKVFIQSGEVSSQSINIMTRCNDEKDSDVALTLNGETVATGQVFEALDYTHTFPITGLKSNTKYTYKILCEPLDKSESSESMEGSFTTAPSPDDAVGFNFVWAADLAGQGWGRNPDFEITTVDGKVVKGGYVVFDMMESLEPEFALFQGDMIYADGPIPAVKPYDGGNWTNNPSKDFDAVTLDEFRENWKYNHGDEKMQSFLAKTPIFVQWDDHEVTNNWYPGETMGAPKYADGTAVDSLYINSLQAFYEFNPILKDTLIYRKQRYGKHAEIFFPDYRSYRDPNPGNDDEDGIAMFGRVQLDWMKKSLKESTATWKIISSHDPFGIVTGGNGDRDSFGQEQPRILGREVELKELLAFIHDEGITGVVSLTSDVHFTAHVNMHPDRAEGNFTDFTPLDEFVIGPIHAGSFGPNYMDTSFGAQYMYEMGPLTMGFERWANLPPAQYELQSFGHAAVTEDGALEIKLIRIDGMIMFEKTMTAPAVVAAPELPAEETSVASSISAGMGLVLMMASLML